MSSLRKPDDYFLSWASPLGIPFNNFRPSTSEAQRKMRIEKNRPGSPCYKDFLSTDTEFTDTPICTASRQYQNLKIKQLDSMGYGKERHARELERITAKDCLCEGLGASALLKEGLTPRPQDGGRIAFVRDRTRHISRKLCRYQPWWIISTVAYRY
ncbi:MAG: hypothetical protein IPI91_07370 [Flavobacteriales bacterium]|nr:hypothetical protein [Flavobacteriales bacterium]